MEYSSLNLKVLEVHGRSVMKEVTENSLTVNDLQTYFVPCGLSMELDLTVSHFFIFAQGKSRNLKI